MNKILMMRGLPASGKTTFANQILQDSNQWVRANLDSLRPMLHGNRTWKPKQERITQQVERQICETLIKNNVNVIIDDTNLTNYHYDKWSSCAKKLNAEFAMHDMDTRLEICLERNTLRLAIDNSPLIPSNNVIVNMARVNNMFEGVAFDKKEIIVDIDGTIANIDHRLHHIRKNPKNWRGFFSEIRYDEPRWDVLYEVVNQAEKENAGIVYVSARPEQYRTETEKWLKEHIHHTYKYKTLIMRHDSDKRKDELVKKDILNRYFKRDRIIAVYDDRLSVIRMWESEGLKVINCNIGGEY